MRRQPWKGLGLAAGALMSMPFVAQAEQPESRATCNEPTEPVTIFFGQFTEGCTIAPTVDLDRFQFDGEAGQRIQILLHAESANLDPNLELLDPTNATIDSSSCNLDECTTSLFDVVLTMTGTHTILVTDVDGDEPGDYVLQLEQVPPSMPIPGLPYGAVVSGAIEPSTDTDFYAFHGTAGTTVQVEATGLTNDLDTWVRLLSDTGETLATDFCFTGAASTCTASLSFDILTDGTYYVAVADGGGEDTGDFELEITCTAGTCEDIAAGLTADIHSVSVLLGGTQNLSLDAGPDNAGNPYLMLGSIGDFVPGLEVNGATLPLSLDNWFVIVLVNPNAAPFSGFTGNLDGDGKASASLTFPANINPALAGTRFLHAFIVDDGVGLVEPIFVSNPVAVELN